MDKVDMSAKAVSTRLKRVAQLRRLGLSLQKSKITEANKRTAVPESPGVRLAQPNTSGSKE